MKQTLALRAVMQFVREGVQVIIARILAQFMSALAAGCETICAFANL